MAARAPSATAAEAAARNATVTGNGRATRAPPSRLAVLDGSRLVGYVSLKDLTHVLALRSLRHGGAERSELARVPRARRAA
jgi:hypothetical protein